MGFMRSFLFNWNLIGEGNSFKIETAHLYVNVSLKGLYISQFSFYRSDSH